MSVIFWVDKWLFVVNFDVDKIVLAEMNARAICTRMVWKVLPHALIDMESWRGHVVRILLSAAEYIILLMKMPERWCTLPRHALLISFLAITSCDVIKHDKVNLHRSTCPKLRKSRFSTLRPWPLNYMYYLDHRTHSKYHQSPIVHPHTKF